MKKILSLALALVLLCTVTSAFATGTTLGVKVYGEDDQHKSTFFKDVEKSTAYQQTAMWLRVANQGQINCTIPLVLIYDTNIDGGENTLSDDYKIVNNSTANIVVTKMEVLNSTQNINSNKPMKLVTENGLSSEKVDAYYVSLSVPDARQHSTVKTTKWEMAEIVTTPTKGQSTSLAGGLFFIPKTGGASGTNETVITVHVKTTPLSFITGLNDGDTQNKSRGVHLLDVKYTVAIDGFDAAGTTYGTTIANGTTELKGSQYVTEGSVTTVNQVKYTYTTDADGATTITATTDN